MGKAGAAIREILPSAWVIVRRELIGLLRSRRAYWITFLTVAAAGLIPLFAWPNAERGIDLWYNFRASNYYFQSLSLAFFLFVPVVTAGSITLERERGTYEGLHCTRLHPWGLVLGKYIASTAFFVFLLALTFPMLALLHLLGGFHFFSILFNVELLLLSVLVMGLVGLWASIRSNRTQRAVLLAFGVLISLFLLALTIIGLFFIPIALLLCLISLLKSARYPDLRESTLRVDDFERSLINARRGIVPAASRTATRPERSWLTRRLLAPSRGGIADGWNPIFVAALRHEEVHSAWLRAVLLFGMAIPVGFMMLASSPHLGPLRLLTGALALILPGAAAASLSSEQTLGKLDLLRGTLLTANNIVSGKLLAALMACSGLVLLGAIVCGFCLATWLLEARQLLFFPVAAATALTAATAGLLGASLTHTVIAGQVLAYVFAAGSLVVFPALTGIHQGSPLLLYMASDRFGWDGILFSIFLALIVSLAQYGLAVRSIEGHWFEED